MLDEYCVMDTALIQGDTAIPEKDKYIFYSIFKDYRGDSGCPVYQVNSMEFIGMDSAGNPDKSKNQGVIISKSFIKYALSKYVN